MNEYQPRRRTSCYVCCIPIPIVLSVLAALPVVALHRRRATVRQGSVRQ